MQDRECKICKETKPLESFRIHGAYRVYRCYDCIKKQSTENNRKQKQAIKDAAGDCWWVEQFCYASIFYYNAQKRR